MAEVVQWIDPDGIALNLDCEWDSIGRFVLPSQFEEEGVPAAPGMRLRAVRHNVRDFTLIHWLDYPSDTLLRAAERSLAASMDPLRGDGRVRVIGPAGDTREITCRVADLGLIEKIGTNSGPTSQQFMTRFRADDPYWYDSVDQTLIYTAIATVATFFPFFPLHLSASATFANTTVTNVGDVNAWPVWTITGPCTDMTMTNLTTNKVWQLTATLTAGQTLVVDTRPNGKTVLRNDGTNLFSSLSTNNLSLWPLIRGNNAIQVAIGGTTTASKAQLVFRPRYISP